jgi:hypothetical protein
LKITPDTTNLGEPIRPAGPSVSVPITIEYRVDVPPGFTLLPPLLKNWVIYGSMIVPPQKVHLSIVNKPDWADVTITNPDVYIDIEENKFTTAQTTLSINVHKEAPARPYTLIVRAESLRLGRVPATFGEAQFPITPGFIPLITATTDKPTQEAGPLATVTFPIRITNNGNEEAIVKVVEIDVPAGWSPPALETTWKVIPQGQTQTFSLSVTTPAGFGWIPGEVGGIHVKFSIEQSPPTAETAAKAGEYMLSLQLRSGGSGAIGLGVGIAALIVIIFVLGRVVLKKKASKQK